MSFFFEMEHNFRVNSAAFSFPSIGDPGQPGTPCGVPFDPHAAVLRYEQEFPDVFHLFEKVGMHPTRSEPVRSIYDSFAPALSYRNIGIHSVGVAEVARTIVRGLKAFDSRRSLDEKEIARRCLLHDVGKPFEIMRAKTGPRTHPTVPSMNSHALHDTLAAAGFSDADATAIATAGFDNGHASVRRFIYIDDQRSIRIIAGNLAGKIVHLADNMVFTSVPAENQLAETTLCVPSERIMCGLAKERYPWLWTAGLALDSNFDVVEATHLTGDTDGIVIGSYASLLVWLSREICRELTELSEPFAERSPANESDLDVERRMVHAVARSLAR